MEQARITITFENEMMARNPDCEPLLTDWIHQVLTLLILHLFLIDDDINVIMCRKLCLNISMVYTMYS